MLLYQCTAVHVAVHVMLFTAVLLLLILVCLPVLYLVSLILVYLADSCVSANTFRMPAAHSLPITDCSCPGAEKWQGLFVSANCRHMMDVQDVLKALGAAADESYAYIASMAVDIPHRRRGVATALLEASRTASTVLGPPGGHPSCL